MSRAEGTESARFGRIVCDDELEDELVTKIEDWILDYQAEVERQRGWSARELEAPASVIPVALLSRQLEDALPCVAVRVERVTGSNAPASREAGMDWTVTIEVFAAGADSDDVRRRVRAHVAAVRALLIQQGGNGPLITNLPYVATEYGGTLIDEEAGRTLGAGIIEFQASVDNVATRWRGGKRVPAADPYAAPAGLVAVVDTNPIVGGLQ